MLAKGLLRRKPGFAVGERLVDLFVRRRHTELLRLCGGDRVSNETAQDTFALRASFLLLSVCAMGAMVQYPFSGRIYFGYVGPLVPLVVLAVASLRRGTPWRLHAMAAVASLVLSVGLLHSWWGSDNRRLQIERASLRVLTRQAGVYEEVVNWVQAHSAPGSFIYATPDAPEVYFLADRRNPTPTFFDFFEPDYGDPDSRSVRLLRLLEDRNVDVVVVLERPQFSRRVSRQFLSEIRARYPHRVRNRRFQVFWRDRQ